MHELRLFLFHPVIVFSYLVILCALSYCKGYRNGKGKEAYEKEMREWQSEQASPRY
jgi:hypothetical protein